MAKQYNHALARVDEQAKRMKSLEKRSVCAFCRENIETETSSPIEIETKYWLVKANDFPYENTKQHFLIIPKIHVDTIIKLPKAFQEDFLPVIAKVEKKYRLNSFGIAMRSGDMHYNGGTVEHLHAHLVVGDTDNPGHKPIRFKMSSRPD